MTYARLESVPYAFITDVLRTMIGLAALVLFTGALLAHLPWAGLLAGGLTAIGVYLTAMNAGRVFIRTQHFAATMAWLLLSQVVVWVAMGIAFLLCRVDAAGFTVSVSILPTAIIVTLLWYLRPLERSTHD